MSTYRVAFVGTGPEPENPNWGESAAMAYRHAAGYDRLGNCELVACADLVYEHAADFAVEFAIPESHVYEDYHEMVDAADPDVVSVATPVPTHADIVVDLAETGVPDAVHCEKPMATTWGDCERMVDACEEAGVQLTFNHQRRFGPQWEEAQRLLADGAIGELRRVEVGGKNLFDYGSHMIDLCNAFADEQRPSWVLCGIDYAEENVRYGAHNENQAVACWEYPDGTYALLSTGDGPVRAEHRLLGTEGEIVINRYGGPDLRVRRAGESAFEDTDFEYEDLVPRAIEEVIAALEADREPAHGADRALRATEVIYAAWESARRRGRVSLPIEITDNPLADLVESGELDPA